MIRLLYGRLPQSHLLTCRRGSVPGLVASLTAVRMWQNTHFGPVDSEHVLRLIIPRATGVALGFQVILASFFLAVLEFKRR